MVVESRMQQNLLTCQNSNSKIKLISLLTYENKN